MVLKTPLKPIFWTAFGAVFATVAADAYGIVCAAPKLGGLI